MSAQKTFGDLLLSGGIERDYSCAKWVISEDISEALR